MKDHLPDKWRAVLRHNSLDSFDLLWSLEADWFEPPNERRGGWSGVSRCELELPEGGKVNIFRKRQENHMTLTLWHPINGQLTFVREMQNILLFKNASVPALEPVYFATRVKDGNQLAILCTEALDDYEPLETLVKRWSKEGWPDKDVRLRLMKAVAKVMSRMHDHKIQHNCFYPKHIFVRFDGDDISVRIIDLEKAKVRILRRFASCRDLYTLNRHSLSWRRTERLRFFLIYLGLVRLDQGAKALWRRIEKRTIAKGRGK
jgi:hypothetical protein